MPDRPAADAVPARPLRVLVVHPLSLRFAGYPFIDAKARALAAHGVELTVLAPFKGEQAMVDGREPSFGRIPLTFDGIWTARAVKRAINRYDPDIIHVWTPRALPSRVGLEAMAATGAALVVNYEDPEHLHFEQSDTPGASRALLAPLDRAAPTAEDVARFVRDLPWPWILDTLPRPFGTPFLHPLFFGLLNQCAAGFTGIVRPWVDLLAQRFGRPALLMPHAVDFARTPLLSAAAAARGRARLGVGPDTLVLLRAGVIYAFVDDQVPMLEGFAAFSRTHPDSLLALCGHNHQQERLTATLDRLGIADRVRWLGFLEAADYADLVAATDIALCPGYPDEYNEFRLAGKIVEYMIAGRPMLCYASGIGRELVDGRDAWLLDPYTAERVAEQLARAAGDPEGRRAMGARARQLAEEWFDVVPLAARMAAFYRRLAPSA